MERQIITVDIAPGYNKVERLKSSQGDIGRPLGVYITQNGTALDCSAYTADLYILKPDGNFFTGTVTVDATEHNLITWDTAEQETPVAGECAAQIRILNNGDDIGTARFVEYVEASPGFCGEASESVVESLMEYVRQAAASAETASGAASSASGSASAASGSASAAASSASAAAGSASTAHTDAETASQAAQTAQDVADSIPEDYSTLSEDVTGLKSAVEQLDANVITESAGPASIISIADGADGMPMRKVEVAIEPVQDLHGYDSPWPAGGGKNVLPYRDDIVNATVDGITYTINKDADGNVISITANGTATQNTIFHISNRVTFPAGSYILSGCPSGGSNPGYMLFDRVEYFSGYEVGNGISATQASEHEIWIAIRITSGITVNNVVFKPMIRPATESDASFAPYSNICPISGWTGAKVTRTWKNLFDQSQLLQATGWALNNDGYYYGTRYSFNTAFNGGFPINPKFKPNTQYTLSFVGYNSQESSNTYFQLNYTDGTYIDVAFGSATPTKYTLTSAAGKTIAYVSGTFGSSGSTIVYVKDIMIEEGVSASDYKPYILQTVSIAFPTEAGTVYGGTLDVVSGKLMVDRVGLDLGNANWAKYDVAQGTLFRVSVPGSSLSYNSTNYIVSNYKVVNAPNRAEKTSSVGAEGNIDIIDSDYADATAFKNAMAGQMAVYPLATPVTYQLTPQEIKTLLGANNIWSDAGNTAITYPADTKLYIEKRISELQALILENNG